jgi:hypothetical protein
MPVSVASRPETSLRLAPLGDAPRGFDAVGERDHLAERLDPVWQPVERHIGAGDKQHRAGDDVGEEG